MAKNVENYGDYNDDYHDDYYSGDGEYDYMTDAEFYEYVMNQHVYTDDHNPTLYQIQQVVQYICTNLSFVIAFTFILVFISDLCRSKPKIKNSFFIIMFVKCVFIVCWCITDIIISYALLEKLTIVIIRIPSSVGHTFDSFSNVIFSVNRFTAIKFPIQYKRIWSIRNTVIVLIITIAIMFAVESSKEFIGITDPNSERLRADLGYALGIFAIVNAYFSMFITLLTICSNNASKKNDLIAKTERKLLYTSIYSTIVYTLCYTNEFLLVLIPDEPYHSLPWDFYNYLNMAVFIVIFGMLGGMVIVLFINR